MCYLWSNTSVYTHTHIHTHTHTETHTQTQTHTHTNRYTSVTTHINTHTHAHSSKHTHTHTHTQTVEVWFHLLTCRRWLWPWSNPLRCTGRKRWARQPGPRCPCAWGTTCPSHTWSPSHWQRCRSVGVMSQSIPERKHTHTHTHTHKDIEVWLLRPVQAKNSRQDELQLLETSNLPQQSFLKLFWKGTANCL